MRLQTFVLAMCLVSSAAVSQPKAPPQPFAGCPVTLADGGYYANDALGATIAGRIVFQPGGSGFVDYDGALGIKFAFERLKPGRLYVGGRRLDGEVGPARAYISDYGDTGFQPIYLLFPTAGCWEITGGVGGDSLTFVMLVEKIGDGPSWRQNGPSAGRRVTTHWHEQ